MPARCCSPEARYLVGAACIEVAVVVEPLRDTTALRDVQPAKELPWELI